MRITALPVCCIVVLIQIEARDKLDNENHCETRGRQLPPPHLNPLVERLIQDWFSLMDVAASGALDVHELEIALRVSYRPLIHLVLPP